MKSKGTPRVKSRGFTFMEVLMVLIFIAAVLVPLLQVFSAGVLVSGEAKDSNTAIILAQRKIEELRNSAYTSISSEAKAAVTAYPAYKSQVVVNTPSTNLKDVTVIVFWSHGAGNEISVSLETYVANF